MAAIGHRAVCGFHRDGVIGAEEHFNGSLCAAEVDLEALSTGEADKSAFRKWSLNMSGQQTLTKTNVL